MTIEEKRQADLVETLAKALLTIDKTLEAIVNELIEIRRRMK